MTSYLRKAFRSKAAEQVEPDEAALIEEMRKLVPSSAIQAFSGSSELPRSGPAEELNLLARYLRAEKMDAEKAAARLQRQAAWRQGWGAVSQEDIAGELASGKTKLQPPTAGSLGRPLIIVKGARHRPGATPQQQQQHIYYTLEAASRYCWDSRSPDNKMVVLFDLQGLQLKNLDATALRAAFNMLSEHFPERMVSVWMLEAPTIFFGIWKLVEPLIDKRARKNIHFVYGKQARAALLEELGPEILPLEYGGTAAEVPVELAAQQLPAWEQQQLEAAGAAGAAGAGGAQQRQAEAASGNGHSHHNASHMLRLSESTSNLAGTL